MELIDNVNETLAEDLKQTIKAKSKIAIAASCFSIYAYQELKEQLEGIDQLKFIFTSPTFTTEKAKKEKREFYIPKLNRERSLYGTEFEVKLRNELSQKAIAKECAEWIKQKVVFKSNQTNQIMSGFVNVDDTSYMPIQGFTTVDLGCEKGNNAYNIVNKIEAPLSNAYLQLFDQLWNDKEKLQEVTDVVIENITAAYNENAPEFLYFVTLYNIFNEFLEDINEDVLPNEATGFKNTKIWNKLYNFQRDAVLAIINKLEKFNGCILADSVGLGKTFTALAVIKYYECRNKNCLVLCPKKLTNNWNTYKDNYINNPIAEDRMNYTVLYHTDLSRTYGTSNGIDLARIRWDNYDLVVIDESHNFRNGGKLELDDEEDEKFNRYAVLMRNVIRKGVRTKVLMLSATPVNNRFNDLKNQLALAYEGNENNINDKLNITKPLSDVFRNAQKAFNKWSEYPEKERTTENLLQMLDFDFFEILDSVTIARSRKHIQKYYDTSAIGTFPKRNKPESVSTPLTDLPNAVTYNEIFDHLMKLYLSVYTPSLYILPSKLSKYTDMFDDEIAVGITQIGREQGIKRITAISLMKRMESSIYSFRLTLERINKQITETIHTIEQYKTSKLNGKINATDITESIDDLDSEDMNDDIFSIGKKVKIDLADMDYLSWQRSLEHDKEIFDLLDSLVLDITPEHDLKLQELIRKIKYKIEHPINEGNKKVIVFSAFSDTVEYLYQNISGVLKNEYNINTALITGNVDGKTTIEKLPRDLNTVLTCFSPISKDRDILFEKNPGDIDVLIATDCISEGQNLQDCDYLINYDIHWNPVRIIQRFGRIDRIGSKNAVIQLVNFWPDISLDEYINLKARVETRMKIVDMTATGDDNIIDPEQQKDMEYRKAQLQRLKDEVVDMEDMTSGISIMDLGLNEFRLDLLQYIKDGHSVEHTPFGLHAVVQKTDELPEGIIFVLKNRSNSVNIKNQNRLHPFYMIYIRNDGGIEINHLDAKKLLDTVRLLCREKSEPIKNLCDAFNKETKNGRNMKDCSRLLSEAIDSIIENKEVSDIDSFLSGNTVDFKHTQIKGLDDFELICFFVVKGE